MVSKSQSVVLVAGVVTLIVVAAVAVALTFQYPISSHGSIRSIGCQVYGNAELTAIISAINWGAISPGDYSNITIWVKNNGTVPINLAFAALNYSPVAAQQYLSLTWNYANQTLAAGAVLPVELRLNISPQTRDLSTFSVNIVITANE